LGKLLRGGGGGDHSDLGAGLLVPTGTVNETSLCWRPVEADCSLLSFEAVALRFLQLTGRGKETRVRAFRSAEIAKVSALSVTRVFVSFRLCREKCSYSTVHWQLASQR
jgi:hypothetical protein